VERGEVGDVVMHDWVSLTVSWSPFLLLIAVWFYFSRTSGMRARSSSGVLRAAGRRVPPHERQPGADCRGAGEAREFDGRKHLVSATGVRCV